MTRSSSILNIAALVGTAMSVAAFAVAPISGSASAAATDGVAQRIDAAFSIAADSEPAPALVAAAARAQKGDLMASAPCATQSWPDIRSECLLMADGTVAAPVRTVTIGYQEGEGTTVLVRAPAPQVASR